MAVRTNAAAPYAPSRAVVDVIERNRNGNLSTPVTLQVLSRIGVSESLAARTLQALRLLDFVDDEGALYPEFQNLRKVPTPDYRNRLADLLRASYADIFAVVNPSEASYQEVHDAFRGMHPSGQINRMTTLFLGLLGHAGWTDLPAPVRFSNGKPPPSKRRAGKSQRSSPSAEPTSADTSPFTPSSAVTPPSGGIRPDVQTVELRSGGSITLVVDVSVVGLSKNDREFVFDLVDRMHGYQAAAVSEPTGNPEQ